MKPVKVPHFMKYLFDHAFLIFPEQALDRKKYIAGNSQGKERYWIAANYESFTNAVEHGYEVMPELIEVQEAVHVLFEGGRIQRKATGQVYELQGNELYVEGSDGVWDVSSETPFSWRGEVFEVLKKAVAV